MGILSSNVNVSVSANENRSLQVQAMHLLQFRYNLLLVNRTSIHIHRMDIRRDRNNKRHLSDQEVHLQIEREVVLGRQRRWVLRRHQLVLVVCTSPRRLVFRDLCIRHEGTK